MPRHYRLAATFGLLGLLMLGCTQPLPGGSTVGVPYAALPTPRPTPTPVPTPTPPPREILPFRTGDHFAFDIRYMTLNGLLGLPVGVLSLDVQQVAYAGGIETIDLTLGVPGSSEPHRIVLKDGMFHYDDKPFVPDHMAVGQSWPAQDGVAGVVVRESVQVPADYYPGCYQVLFTNPKNERLVLWFAPGVGLVKGSFKLASFGEGQIELKEKPSNLRIGL